MAAMCIVTLGMQHLLKLFVYVYDTEMSTVLDHPAIPQDSLPYRM